jgi:hypothetical protein
VDTAWAQQYSFIPAGYVGPGGIVIMMLGVFGAAYGTLLVASVSWWLVLRRARREELAMLDGAGARLRPGPRRMVRGRVERAASADQDAPVEVDIVEMVHDHTSKQSRWHTWEETTRHVRAESFRLIRDDGTGVLVEPGQDVLVVDSLTSSYPQNRPLHRIRSAIIAHGAEVHVYGDLHRIATANDGPYRGSGTEFALRPPRGRPMLIATQSLRERHDGVLQMLRRWLIALVCGYAFVHALVTLPFLVTSGFHTDTEAYVQSARIETVRGKNGVSYRYLVTVSTEDGFVLRDQQISHGAYSEIERRGGKSYTKNRVAVPILRTFDSEALSFVGTEPSVLTFLPVSALLLGLLFGVIAFFHCRSKLAWYDMSKVTEPGASGHWVEPRPQHPVVVNER